MSMLYPKPKGMKYTDLCIFFDENFWLENEKYNEVKCYQYLYCIIYMIALKKKLFKLYSDYESFTIFATSTVYMRWLKKKKHKNYEKTGSILNYIKSTINYLKMLYNKQEYLQNSNSDDAFNESIKNESIKNVLKENIINQYSYDISQNIINIFKEIPLIIKNNIKNLQYKNDKILMKNIELSCILTLFKSFKINIKNKNVDNVNVNYNFNDKIITLFRLDDSYKDLIILLCNKIKKEISNKISKELSENILDNSILDNILNTAWEETNYIQTNNSCWEENN